MKKNSTVSLSSLFSSLLSLKSALVLDDDRDICPRWPRLKQKNNWMLN